MATARRRVADPYIVFVSYSHKDRWIAKQCVRLIEEAGQGKVRTFLDAKDIDAGERIEDKVLDAIRKCDELVVLLSANSINRPWVLFEIGVARGRKKPVIAILNNLSPREMPEMIGPYKGIDLNDFDGQYLEQMQRRSEKKRR